MALRTDPPLAVFHRRRAMRLAYWNGAIWSIGNGLASSLLILYLAMELDVPGIGLGISLILAAPQLTGLLRLGVPALIGRLTGRKPFCLAAYLLSGVVIATLPLVATPGRLPTAAASLTAMVALWCTYQLLEYLGTIALWSWLADLVPQAVRGRFLGRRERWMAAGQAAAMLSSGLFVWGWQQTRPELPRWIGYAIPAMLGAAFIAAAVVPLALMPGVVRHQAKPTGVSVRAMWAPLTDTRFLRLLAVRCWLSLFNGVIQSPQNLFPNRVLGIRLFTMLALKVGLRLGQWIISPRLGRLIDRVGNRPVLVLSLLVVAEGPLFYFLATFERPWWIVGAWACWIGWAGLNIGLPNLMLKITPGESNTPYIATWFAVADICHGLSTILGGVLFDKYRNTVFNGLGITMDYYHAAFLFGWITWNLGAIVLLWLVQEGPAKDRCRTAKP